MWSIHEWEISLIISINCRGIFSLGMSCNGCIRGKCRLLFNIIYLLYYYEAISSLLATSMTISCLLLLEIHTQTYLVAAKIEIMKCVAAFAVLLVLFIASDWMEDDVTLWQKSLTHQRAPDRTTSMQQKVTYHQTKPKVGSPLCEWHALLHPAWVKYNLFQNWKMANNK